MTMAPDPSGETGFVYEIEFWLNFQLPWSLRFCQAVEHAFPTLHDRDGRELSGPGQCLGDSPYAPVSGQSQYAPDRDGQLVATLVTGEHPVLRLDNAVDDGLAVPGARGPAPPHP